MGHTRAGKSRLDDHSSSKLAECHGYQSFDEHGADVLEVAALAAYVSGQCRSLLVRHRYEDFVLVRTIADFHQHVASEVKRGDVAAASAQMAALIALWPDNEELSLTCAVSGEPVLALLDWTSGDDGAAVAHVEVALTAAATLAGTYGHDYLSARQVYLASNIVRVQMSSGDLAQAASLCDALMAVAAGAVSRWPFPGAAALRLPLEQDEGRWVTASLTGLRRTLAAASGATGGR